MGAPTLGLAVVSKLAHTHITQIVQVGMSTLPYHISIIMLKFAMNIAQ